LGSNNNSPLFLSRLCIGTAWLVLLTHRQSLRKPRLSTLLFDQCQSIFHYLEQTWRNTTTPRDQL
jgi:hypothetical protein